MKLIYEKSQLGRRGVGVPKPEGLDDALLVAVTEKRTVDEIDRLVEALS